MHLPNLSHLLAQVPLPLAFSATEEIVNKPNKHARQAAIWTLVGTWLLITGFAISTGGFVDLWNLLVSLCSGQTTRDQLHTGDTMRMAPTIAAAVSANLPAVIPFGMWANKVVKLGRDEHAVNTMTQAKKPSHLYLVIMLTLFAEEVYARFFYLGELSKIAILASAVGFYFLFLVGNATWALVHLGNIKKKNVTLNWRQRIIFVLPQFVCGIFFTAVYVPYGFFGALITHVAYDMVLFATSRVDVFDLGEKLLASYHFVLGVAASVYFFAFGNESLFDMKYWLTDGLTKFNLEGWTFWEYASGVVLLYCFGKVALELLLFDHHGATTWVELFRDWLQFGTYLAAAYVVVLGLLGLPFTSLPVLAVALSLIAAFAAKTSSGSGVARVFWEGLLLNSLVVCTVLALENPRHIVGFLGILMLVNLPDNIIRHLDKDDLPPCDDLDCTDCRPAKSNTGIKHTTPPAAIAS